jgi:hypothetical protein
MIDLKIHPAADWLPTLPDAEYEELKADIQARGQREPILVKDGHIIDGRHRYRACNELGIEPQTEEYVYSEDGMIPDIIAEIASRNLFRRNLTPQERADLVVKMCGPQLAAEARGRQKSGLRQGGKSPVALKSAQRETRGRTAERIAGIAGVGRDTARKALRAHGHGQRDKPKNKPAVKAKVEAAKQHREAAIDKVRTVLDSEFADAISRGSLLKRPADLIEFAAQADAKILEQGPLIMVGWSFKQARLFRAKEITEKHLVRDLIDRAVSQGALTPAGCTVEVKPFTVHVVLTKHAKKKSDA